jgi:hypothetical protein
MFATSKTPATHSTTTNVSRPIAWAASSSANTPRTRGRFVKPQSRRTPPPTPPTIAPAPSLRCSGSSGGLFWRLLARCSGTRSSSRRLLSGMYLSSRFVSVPGNGQYHPAALGRPFAACQPGRGGVRLAACMLAKGRGLVRMSYRVVSVRSRVRPFTPVNSTQRPFYLFSFASLVSPCIGAQKRVTLEYKPLQAPTDSTLPAC